MRPRRLSATVFASFGPVGVETETGLRQLQQHLLPHLAEAVEPHVEEPHVVAVEVLDLQRREVAGLLHPLPPEGLRACP